MVNPSGWIPGVAVGKLTTTNWLVKFLKKKKAPDSEKPSDLSMVFSTRAAAGKTWDFFFKRNQ